jgi:hypothetical protein
MGILAANFVGVLMALILLGGEVWVIGIAVLAYVASRELITFPVLGWAGAVMGTSAVAYIIVVILIGFLVSP